MSDFALSYDSEFFILTPLSASAREWIEHYVEEPATVVGIEYRERDVLDIVHDFGRIGLRVRLH